MMALRWTSLLSLTLCACGEPPARVEPTAPAAPPDATAPAQPSRPAWAAPYGGPTAVANPERADAPDPVAWSALASGDEARFTLTIPAGAKVFTDTVAARVVESADGLSLGAWTPPPPHGGTVGAAETEQRARWTRDVELRAPIQRAPGASGRLLVEVDHQTCVADRCWPVRSTRHELFVTPPR